jgi:hypothetical protein
METPAATAKPESKSRDETNGATAEPSDPTPPSFASVSDQQTNALGNQRATTLEPADEPEPTHVEKVTEESVQPSVGRTSTNISEEQVDALDDDPASSRPADAATVGDGNESLIGGIPVDLARDCAKEYEAMNHAAFDEFVARVKSQGARNPEDARAILLSMRRDAQKKNLAICAKYGLGSDLSSSLRRLGEILRYAEEHGWIELKQL